MSPPDPVPDILLAERGFLRALARELVADEHAADDVLQDAALAWLTHPPRDAGAARAWLASVVRHLASNARRGNARRDAREQFVARPEGVPSEALIDAGLETQRRVLAAVLALREPYKTVIWLRWYEELPPRAIAERTGRTVETVKSQLKRGLAELRARLDGEFGDRASWCALLAPLGEPSLTRPTLAPLAAAAVLALAVSFAVWRARAPHDVTPDPVFRAASALPSEVESPLDRHPAFAEREPLAPPVPTPATHTWRVRVRDEHDGAALPALGVRVTFADGSSTVAGTNADGELALDAPAAPSGVAFFADELAADTRAEPVEVAAGDTRAGGDVTLAIGPTYALAAELPPGLAWSAVEARLVLPNRAVDDRDAPRAHVNAGHAPWVRFGRTPRLSLLGAGERSMYVLELASRDGLWRGVARVHATPGTHLEPVRVTFDARARLQGRFRALPPAETRALTVHVASTVSQLPRALHVAEDGSFDAGELPPGNVRVTVESPLHETFEQELEIAALETRSVEWELAPVPRRTVRVELHGPTIAGDVTWRALPDERWTRLAASSNAVELSLPRARVEIAPPFAGVFAWDPPSALVEPGDAKVVFTARSVNVEVERVTLRAVDANSGASVDRFRAHVVIDRLGRGRKVAVDLDGGGLSADARDGAAVFASIPPGTRGWWLVEAEGRQSAWGELADLDAAPGGRTRTVALAPAWTCAFEFSARDERGRVSPLRGVSVRTRGGAELATSLGDGVAFLDLTYDPGELALALDGWRVAEWEGFAGGKRRVALDVHHILFERAR